MKKINNDKSVSLNFIDGFKFFFIGQSFVWKKHRELTKYFAFSMLMGLIIFIAGTIVFVNYIDIIAQWIWAKPNATLLIVFWWLMKIVVWLVLWVTTLMISFFLFMLIAAPFNDIVSEQVEGILGTWKATPFSFGFLMRDLGITVVFESLRLLIKLAFLIPLFLAGLFIPVVGQILYVVLGGYLLARSLGMDYIDWSLARRGYSWSERFDFVKKHHWPVVGFGASMMFAIMIPFGFVIFWPGAIAGGTILCTKLNPEDKRIF